MGYIKDKNASRDFKFTWKQNICFPFPNSRLPYFFVSLEFMIPSRINAPLCGRLKQAELIHANVCYIACSDEHFELLPCSAGAQGSRKRHVTSASRWDGYLASSLSFRCSSLRQSFTRFNRRAELVFKKGIKLNLSNQHQSYHSACLTEWILKMSEALVEISSFRTYDK